MATSKEKKENFIRIAEARTNKIISGITSLGNLSNRSYYEYTPEQIETIFNAIQLELDRQKENFEEKKKNQKKFRL